jgi:hypothetical protein
MSCDIDVIAQVLVLVVDALAIHIDRERNLYLLPRESTLRTYQPISIDRCQPMARGQFDETATHHPSNFLAFGHPRPDVVLTRLRIRSYLIQCQ